MVLSMDWQSACALCLSPPVVKNLKRNIDMDTGNRTSLRYSLTDWRMIRYSISHSAQSTQREKLHIFLKLDTLFCC